MPVSQLVHLQQQATARLPREMARELAEQIDQMQLLGELTRSAVTENQENLVHVAREMEEGFVTISAVFSGAPPGTEGQQEELLAQVDLVLANNRQLLEEAHQANLDRIRDAASQRPVAQSSALNEFLEGATFGWLKR